MSTIEADGVVVAVSVVAAPAADSRVAILKFAACSALPACCSDSRSSDVAIVTRFLSNKPTPQYATPLRYHAQVTGNTDRRDGMCNMRNNSFPLRHRFSLQPNGLMCVHDDARQSTMYKCRQDDEHQTSQECPSNKHYSHDLSQSLTSSDTSYISLTLLSDHNVWCRDMDHNKRT